jgi:hypothetical protein
MPDTLHPPYGNSQVQPRTLVRWLDVNSQNGPLSRTRKVITIPSCSVSFGWKGYSDIIYAINCVASNRFSLKNLNTTSDDYVLCISFKKNVKVFRYFLWDNSNSKFYFSLPSYSGETIEKNFRFEFWSCKSAIEKITIDNTTITIDNTQVTVDSL